MAQELSGPSRPAQATILGAQPAQVAVGVGPSSVVALTEQLWDLNLHVTPEGDQAFDVQIKQLWPQTETLKAGQVVPVRYDPADHSKVVIDRSPASQGSALASMVESFMGPQQIAEIQQLGLGSVGDMIKQAMADPQGFSAKIQERAAAAAQAAEANAAAMTEKLKAAQAAGQGDAAPPQQGSAEAQVDALTKLADLRDRGVLSAEEFEAQKKRLLGE